MGDDKKWSEAELRAALPAAIARYTVGREHTILGDINADDLAQHITTTLGARGEIPDLMTVYEWRLEQIRQCLDAAQEGELPFRRALEKIDFTLGVWLPPNLKQQRGRIRRDDWRRHGDGWDYPDER